MPDSVSGLNFLNLTKMKKDPTLFLCGALLCSFAGMPQVWAQDAAGQETMPGAMEREPMQTGEYAPSWESLSKYECPEWFRDAKFGIWAHWGPQCEPESGDWYARNMYYPGEWQYNVHLQKYGNPKDFGFKDVIHIWEAEEWEPDSLVRFYKSVGARYFMALANHHDNLDLWDSKYQPWNSVNMGPKRDIVGEWAEACGKYGLPLGVSIHASHAWTWMEGAQDFDGKLTKEDGKGLWWEGYDPQDLYEQRHERSEGSRNVGTIHSQWEWGNGASQPSEAYKTKLYNRSLDLINRYHPSLVYFDDTAVPFYPVSNEGLEIVAHMYNKSLSDHDGQMQAVILGKKLTEEQKDGMVWDVERGIPDRPQEKYWQTCTCLGQWHYDRGVYDRNEYKTAPTVVKMLVDIVSKNGNLLLSVPLRGSGAIDEKEVAILQGIKAWMDINGESIFGTRPWKVFGEGPLAEASKPINNQGFNEGQNYTAADIRYVEKDGVVYATALGWPAGDRMVLENLSAGSPYVEGFVEQVELLGYGPVDFADDLSALNVTLPDVRPNGIAPVLKVTFTHDVSYADLQALAGKVEGELERVAPFVGVNSGQYLVEYVERLQQACRAAGELPADAGVAALSSAYAALKAAYADFVQGAQVAGGVVTDVRLTQNVTAKYLVEARHFSRTDKPVEAATRFGLLAEPWIVTPNIINKDNNTRGGFDGFLAWNSNGGRAIGVQKWDGWEAAIEDGMIYQTTTLPAGKYSLRMNVHEQAGLAAGEVRLLVAEGRDFISGDGAEGRALAAFDMSATATGSVADGCGFTQDKPMEVSIGWLVNIPAEATGRSMRVTEIHLLRDGVDVSADYLSNYKDIQRKDVAYKRFGTPAYWTVDNFRIPQNNDDGTKQGIDQYEGYNALMLGLWDDAAAATGDLSAARIYKAVRLPAGTYFFGGSYNQLYQVRQGYVFAATELPTASGITGCLAYSPLTDASADGKWYGVRFTLPTDSTVCLGWTADLTQGAGQQEFRVSEVALLRYLEAEGEWIEGEALGVDGQGVIDLPASRWAKVDQGTPGLDAGTAYVAAGGQTEISLGQLNLESVDRVELKAVSQDGPVDCRFCIDGEETPWATVALPASRSMSAYQVASADCPSQAGVHDVTLRVPEGARVNLLAVRFVDDDATSVGGVEQRPGSPELRWSVSGTELTLYGLQDAKVRLYDAGGRMVLSRSGQNGTVTYRLPSRGVYVVQVDGTSRTVVTE